MESKQPIFLGVSTRASRRGYGWDLLGVSSLVLFPYFPQKLAGLQCVIGISPEFLEALLKAKNNDSSKITLTDQSKPTNKGFINLGHELRPVSMQIAISGSKFVVPPVDPEDTAFSYVMPRTDCVEIVPLPMPPLLIREPSQVTVDFEFQGNQSQLGEFLCDFAQPLPLSDGERRAIASRPSAIVGVGMGFGCNKCRDEIEVYGTLCPGTPPPQNCGPAAVALESAPDSWTCKCGASNMNLSYLKLGVHDVFRRPWEYKRDPISDFTPLYEAGRIEVIHSRYEALIASASTEEPVQKFIEEHSILWGFLSPVVILHKPAVLTKKKADFGILTQDRVLYLVEIEKPVTRLVNKNGSIAAEIQKGADQIRDWQLVVSDRRSSLLKELDIDEGEVHDIRYLLIGGLAKKTSHRGLAKLRGSPLAPKTDFYCFDELGSFLHVLSAKLRTI